VVVAERASHAEIVRSSCVRVASRDFKRSSACRRL
jgi:hypothetical protein